MRAPWQLTPVATGLAGRVFEALSLGQANYKPSPILPPSEDSLNGLSLPGNDFQVKGEKGGLRLPHQDYNETKWGQPSYLYIPRSLGQQEKKGAVGPGNCPAINASYTPEGGWESLPSNVTFDAFNDTRATTLRYREQVGVNLGSWFVNENWMAPSMFDCSTGNKSAELDILEGYGSSSHGISNATARMEKHWDTWIREEDFQKMAGLGVNTVRIPIGYWTLGGNWTDNSPFAPWGKVYERSWRYLARGIKWAAKYNIGVLVDLHGAYGAANDGPISGVSNGDVGFFSAGNMSLTAAFLTNLTERLVNVTNVVGIEILNEPVNVPELWTWYNETISSLRTVEGASSFPFYFQDAFNLTQGTEFINSRREQDFVVDDTHLYYVYTSQDKNASAGEHTRDINGPVDRTLNASATGARGNVVVGEWSCALADSSLRGYKKPQEAERAFCEAENDVFGSTTAGTIYWSYTMEACGDNAGWCFKAAAKEYLTSPFALWNISEATYNALNRFNGSQQIDVAGKIAENISSLPIPALPAQLRPTESRSSSGGPSPTQSHSGSGASSPTRTAASGHSKSSSSAAHSASSSHLSCDSKYGCQSNKSSSSTGTSRSHPTSSSVSKGVSRTTASRSSSGFATRTKSNSEAKATSSGGSHSRTHSRTHSGLHSHSGSAAPASTTAASSPPGFTVVTIDWSQPVAITTSLQVSGEVTLSLPIHPGASSLSAHEPHSRSKGSSAEYSAHKTESQSKASSAPSHKPSASRESAKRTSTKKVQVQESKSSVSSSSIAQPTWSEVPGKIIGRSMRGGSPAARAIALMRQEREHAHEKAKRAAAVVALEATPPKSTGSNSSESKHDQRVRMVVDTGYSDGFLSAKIFASDNLGRIGFRGQYVLDSWRARIQAGTLDSDDRYQGDYTTAFNQGVDEAHSQITSAIEIAVAAM